ncbi:MAG TPA: flagellar filament capping protein FliD [Blastocatellia bacterium]|nr:flagellar filament capping protein FliD [Blastocatellia bacterium]
MASVANFSGLGSGIDFSKLTEAILAEKTRPISQLQSRSAQISKTNEALKQLNAKLATLTEAANTLTNKELGKGRQASSSATDKILPTVTATAATGTFDVTVTRLATSLAQASRVYAAPSTAILAGGATTATFELRLGDATTGTAITINSANNSLQGLRDAINNANAGVSATIVDTNGSGTQNKLVLTSTATGAAGRVQLVETTATGTGTDLALTSLNPPGATTDFSALDAQFTVNGLPLTRSSNTVSDALTGVTFNLLSSGSANIKVTANTSELENKLKSFITAYNDVQDFISAQYTKDATGRPTGPLVGEATLRSVQTQLRNAVGQSFATNGGTLANLTEVGVGRDDKGRLVLDSKVFNERVKESGIDNVRALFAGKASGDKGIANEIYTSYKTLSDDLTGIVRKAITGNEDSIKRLDKSIADQLARVSTLRQSLSRQFAAADAAISQLNSQGTSLTNIFTAQNSAASKK